MSVKGRDFQGDFIDCPNPDLRTSCSIGDSGLFPAVSCHLHQGPVLPVALGSLQIEAGRLHTARPAFRRCPIDRAGQFQRLF